MKRIMVIEGRARSAEYIALVARLIANNPTWPRTPQAGELRKLSEQRDHKGRLKDVTCRIVLRRLEQADHIKLPMPRGSYKNQFRKRSIRPPSFNTVWTEALLSDRLPARLLHVDEPQHNGAIARRPPPLR